MKRTLAAILIVLVTVGFAYAKAYEVNRKAGDYNVLIKMDKNPPSVGTNNMEIIITDKTGAAVKDAKVVVDYGMPAMPGMPAMAYKADTMRHGEGYHTVLNISMKGPWYVNLRITSQGKTVSTKVTFDVN